VPNWNYILKEMQTAKKAGAEAYDKVRRKYLARLFKYTGRNVIVYYSGWLQKEELARQGFIGFSLNDADKSGFMAVIHQLDRSLGLDLILHTSGGSVAATESLVYYLRQMFGQDIRVFIPQIAMSAGTMIACASKEIWMGKHSSLGPIDPQVLGIAAHGVVEEFERARREIREDPATIPLWQPILAKYEPAFIGECQKAMEWTKQMVKQWLITGMFDGDTSAATKADGIIAELGDHALTKSHSRHIDPQQARSLQLNVRLLEEDDGLQDAVLNVHHSCILTLGSTGAYKIIENHKGVAFIQQIQQVIVPSAPGQPIVGQDPKS